MHTIFRIHDPDMKQNRPSTFIRNTIKVELHFVKVSNKHTLKRFTPL